MTTATEQENRVAELTANLSEQIKEYTANNENFKAFLAMTSKLSSYSVNNMLLIAQQRPDATICAGYKSWETNFDRHVNAGAKGIQIVCPVIKKVYQYEPKKDADGNILKGSDDKPLMNKVEKTETTYRVGYIFDVSDTSGAPLPEIANIIDVNDRDYSKVLESIIAAAPVPVTVEQINSGANGFYNLENNDIHISSELPDSMKVKVLIHELAHQILHSKNGIDSDASKNEKEVSAEAVAYVVCNYYGLNTSDYSFGYIGSWSANKDGNELRAKLDEIRKTANLIINKIDYQAYKMQIVEKDQLSYKSAAGYVQVSRCDDGYRAELYDSKMLCVNATILDAAGKTIDVAASEAMKIFHLNPDYMNRIDDKYLSDKIEKTQTKLMSEKSEKLVADKINFKHKM